MKMKKRRIIALLAIMVMIVMSFSGCGSKGDGNAADFDWDQTYVGNYVFEDNGSNLDADGARFTLYVTDEKFFYVGVKPYEDNLSSVMFAEGPSTITGDGVLQCLFVVYCPNSLMYYENYDFKVRRDGTDGNAEEKFIENVQSKIDEFQNANGGQEYFEIQLNVTSNDPLNRGTFSVISEGVTLGWDSWELD